MTEIVVTDRMEEAGWQAFRRGWATPGEGMANAYRAMEQERLKEIWESAGDRAAQLPAKPKKRVRRG